MARRDAQSGEGFCGLPATPVVARAGLHLWEEPCVSGVRGSGAVFFSGCVLRCVYCQNHAISHENFGKPVSVERLREIFWELIGQGAHNINLVSPTPFAPAIREALAEPLPVPVVWNTGGYERVETLRSLEGKVQVWLPDLKYVDSGLSRDLSGAADYFGAASAAIEEMVRQTGDYVLEDGLLKRGVLIRHLMLPGRWRTPRRCWTGWRRPSGPARSSSPSWPSTPPSRGRRACSPAGSPGRSTAQPCGTWRTWGSPTATARTPPPPGRSTPRIST